jgi:hypothetical protein
LGLPPYKQIGASIRNPRHPHHIRFLKLREAAIEIMDGRKWTDGPVSMDLIMYAPAFEKGKQLLSYVGGIMDTLDGSHGPSFTYLPIVYQDDCQVSDFKSEFNTSTSSHYAVTVEFLRG